MFLDLEQQLIDRLQATLPAALPDLASTLKVVSARDLAGVKEQLQWTPSVQIHGGQYRPLEQQNAGRQQSIEQTWYAVVVVRNSADQQSGAGPRNSASEVITAVLSSLLGFRPAAPFGPLKLTTAPAPAYSAGGFGYYPLAFTSQFSVRASNS